MQFLSVAASLRKDSVNKKLAKLTAQLLLSLGHKVDLADFSEFTVPLYDGDIESGQGVPERAKAFVARMHTADGLIISSPEYNFSIPGTLKNLIDWISRITPMPFTKQKIYLMSASPGLVGGNRGLWHTRVPLEATGAMVYPSMFSLASAYEAFNEQGELKDLKLQDRLNSELINFIDYCNKLK